MKGMRVGRVAGFPLAIDWSVLVIVWLLAWGLAAGSLPETAPGYSTTDYWIAGIAGAALLIASLLAHEVAHAVVAQHAGLSVHGLTLWMFGGIAELGGEPASARDDLRIALVGPMTSLALGAGFGLTALVLEPLVGSKLVIDVIIWLAGINVLLAVFNLVPGAPLDGGRVLRALLWRRSGDRVGAAVSAARAGRVVAYTLVALGLLELVATGSIGGLWLAFIGLFVLNAARAEEADVVARDVLAGVTVADVMTRDPSTVPGWMTVEDFVEQYLLGHRHSSYPVVSFDGHVVGMVTLAEVRAVPPGERSATTLQRIAVPLARLATATPADSLVALLSHLGRADGGRALVFDGDDLVGLVTPTDVTRAIDLGMLSHAHAGPSL